MSLRLATTMFAVASIVACANQGGAPMPVFSQAALPDAVRVPAGHQVAMETSAAGDIRYECRARADASGQFEWAFVGPDAELKDRGGKPVGRYYGPPATWEHLDGSKLTGSQVSVAPAAQGNIPLQLVKANPAGGKGSMQGMAYIQRVNTRGGVAPALPCSQPILGQRQMVQYQADYIFWRAG